MIPGRKSDFSLHTLHFVPAWFCKCLIITHFTTSRFCKPRKKIKKIIWKRTPALPRGRSGNPRYPWESGDAYGLRRALYARYSYAISVIINDLQNQDVGLPFAI